MSRRFQCPFPGLENHWIDLPDLPWLGKHAQRRDEAAEKSKELGQTLQSFAVSLALLDDWDLPGMSGNPEKWDYTGIDLRVINWVSSIVISDFALCFEIPKN
jgi:hypothetical protein